LTKSVFCSIISCELKATDKTKEKIMKNLTKALVSLITIFALSLSIFADEAVAKKIQIDWLISGAGGSIAAAGGNPEDGSGYFFYNFTSEDGEVKGTVTARNGNITITGGSEAEVLAKHFTQHFATLTRTGHFHASHKLSARSTEEYPTKEGSKDFITFCYASLDDGGLMSGMILDGKVKFISGLTKVAGVSTNNNTNTLDTGAKGVTIIAGVAILSATAAILSRKRRKS